MRILIKSAPIVITSLLAFTRRSTAFWSFSFGHGIMNELYTWIQDENIFSRELDDFYVDDEVMLDENGEGGF